MKMNRRLHKWLSLFVAVQLLIWLATGLYFNLIDKTLESVNEQKNVISHHGHLADYSLLPLTELDHFETKHIEMVWVLGKPYYQLFSKRNFHRYQPEQSFLVSAVSGQRKLIDQAQIETMASLVYGGKGQLLFAELKSPPFEDHSKQQNPMWQASFDDSLNTVIYFDAVTGKTLRYVNDDVRFRDLMLKLHFMDYFDSGGFNHWLIIVFALASLALSLTGCIWVVSTYRKGGYRLSSIKG